ncbi:hypothetical protein ACFL1H_01195 [Nanoarchaeota archaeon]
MHKLEKRLNQIIYEFPDEYPLDSIARVVELIEYQESHNNKLSKWNIFEDIKDYQLYKEINFEWDNCNSERIREKEGGIKFMSALNIWLREQPEDKRQEYRDLVINIKRKDYSKWDELTNLEQRLNKFLYEHPDEYTLDTIGRVVLFIEHKELFNGRSNWNIFEEIEDFQLYKELYPEWDKINTNDIQFKKDGNAFYVGFSKWLEKYPKKIKEKYKAMVFPPQVRDWSGFTSIEDWGEFYLLNYGGLNRTNIMDVEGGSPFYGAFFRWVEKQPKKYKKEYWDLIYGPVDHPEWYNYSNIKEWVNCYEKNYKGLSTGTIREKEGGNSFYRCFRNWVKKQPKSKRKKYMTMLFPPKNKDWSKINSIEDWGEYFLMNFGGLTTAEIQDSRVKGGGGFYRAFIMWVLKQPENMREGYRKMLFPPQYKDWTGFNSIEDWLEYYEKNFNGLSGKQLLNCDVEGAEPFYWSFIEWIDKQNLSLAEKKALRRTVLPEQKAPFKFEFGYGDIHFDSSPERTVGILLHKYGLIKEFKENKNLHVRTNGKKLHSIDFLVENTFIEYHPLQPIDKSKGRNNYEKFFNYKLNNINNTEFEGFYLWYIWEIDHLFEVLKDPIINSKMKKRYRNLTKKQFKKHVYEAYKKGGESDIKNYGREQTNIFYKTFQKIAQKNIAA